MGMIENHPRDQRFAPTRTTDRIASLSIQQSYFEQAAVFVLARKSSEKNNPDEKTYLLVSLAPGLACTVTGTDW
jgi:hypothetical protein